MEKRKGNIILRKSLFEKRKLQKENKNLYRHIAEKVHEKLESIRAEKFPRGDEYQKQREFLALLDQKK